MRRRICGTTALIAVSAFALSAASTPVGGTSRDHPVAASDHTCAITTVGGVRCWGSNEAGGLGDSSRTSSATPVDVVGLASGVTAVAAGDRYSCALTTVGGVKCWGYNEFGQLGDGTTIDRPTPVDVVGLTRGVSVIAARGEHTCALIDRGLKCWGANINGQLGDGTTMNRWTPVGVVGLTDEVTAIATGGEHTCAIIAGGGVKCWGWNGTGQLGIGTTADMSTPVDVTGLASGVSAIAAGGRHTCALMTGGTVRCWGFGAFGQLGNAATTNAASPIEVVGLATDTAAIILGGNFSCAVTSDGVVACWGVDLSGVAEVVFAPTAIAGLPRDMRAVVAGFYHACGVRADGVVMCWGGNDAGQLGDSTIQERSTPVEATNADGTPFIAFGAPSAGPSTEILLVTVTLLAVLLSTATAGAAVVRRHHRRASDIGPP